MATVAVMLRDRLSPLRELCSLGLHAEVLVPAVLELLHNVVPSSRNLFDWTDSQGRLVRYFVEGPIDAEIARRYFDEFHNRREAEAMPVFQTLYRLPAGVRGADELDHPGFFASALYREIWRPQGFRTRLEGVLRGRQRQLLGSLVLYRGPGDACFTRADEQQLSLVLPLLAAGIEACGAARADDRHVPSPEPSQTLLLTLDGELRHASDAALRLLLLADGGASRASLSRPVQALAGNLVRLLLQRLAERSRHDSAHHRLAPPPSITHENHFGQFVATGQLLRALRAGDPPLAQVTLTRLEPHRVALERALRGLPITAGQRAVCRALYAGQQQAEVAQALGVAATTVVDHVRKVYRRLEVRSVVELKALLDRRIG